MRGVDFFREKINLNAMAHFFVSYLLSISLLLAGLLRFAR